jgi:alpha-L-arabinofuranosidase
VTRRERPGPVGVRRLVGLVGLLGLLALLALPAAARAQPAVGLVARWTFDAGSGTTAADAVRHGPSLTLRGGAGWGGGLVGAHALALGGHGAYAASSGAVLDTTGSYSVAAWVKPASTSGYQTFVSQDGTQVSGFFLQLRNGHFALSIPAADSTKAPVTIAAATDIIPQPGEWYPLTGVVDAGAHTVSLYVNGTLAASKPAPTAWPAGGAVAVGRALYGGTHRDFVDGEIDDVRAYDAALPAASVAALAGPGGLTVDAGRLGPRIRPTQFGEFLEEINHSGDGGLYAELVRNRDLEESGRRPIGYTAVGGAAASIALTRADPLTSAIPVSLRLSVAAHGAHGRVGIANGGWWGIPVRPDTTYRVSFQARASPAARGAPLSVSLQSDTGHVWARATVGRPSAGWRRYTATLHTPKGFAASLRNRLVISLPAARASGGSDWFTLVSLFPPTYDKLRNGFRVDLMRRLAALRPGYLRIPGGNALEGKTIATRFDWETTIGPIAERPGHFDSAWGYWSQDGLGLLEYLELAEELHARPILAVWAGYTLGDTVVARGRLHRYVTRAVDELQYATGSTSTYWGHERAIDGHPAPFPVHMVEIGNEDYFDGTGSYGTYRYPMFYDAIHRAFPHIRMIASEPVTSRPVFAVDHHYYARDPARFAQDAHLFDDFNPRGAKVLVGEYGAVDGSPTGTLAAALGEAAFLTGTVRDSDVVLGASYAPLLVNVHARDWPTSLIGYNALRNAPSPSYWVQRMMARHLGTRVIGTQLAGGPGTLFQVATSAPGHVYLTVVNNGPVAATLPVSLVGLGTAVSAVHETVLAGAPSTRDTLADPRAVAPHTTSLGPVGATFTATFAADSVTVLDLATPAIGAQAR